MLVLGANLDDLGIAQRDLSRAALQTAFGRSVERIFRLSAQSQMSRIATAPHIAHVHDDQFGVDLSPRKSEGEAMRRPGPTVKAEDSITVATGCGRPQPAVSLGPVTGRLVDLCPKPLLV